MTEAEKIDHLVETLDISIAEAKDIIEQDKVIDKGGRTYFDLSKEAEKMAKKFANVGTRKAPTVYKFDKKENRKANPTKEGIIEILAESLRNCGLAIENLEIPNKGKLITFSLGGNSFKLDLIQQRAKK
jgi:DNA-directed RNA polymerase subunit F